MTRQRSLTLALLVIFLGSLCLPPLQALAEGEDDPLWNRPSFEKKINDVGQRILAANGFKERVAFYYKTKDERNAYAKQHLSPNEVYVYKDMLDVITSDDELAALLCHEIAHIMKRHGTKTFWIDAPIKVGTMAVAGAATIATYGLGYPLIKPLALDSHQLMIAPFERGFEKEADLVGLDYLVKAGYNPLAMETLFSRGGNGDGGPVTRAFSTHPLGSRRVEYIHEAIKEKYPQFLTEETANNPTPGSTYAFQPSDKGKKAETVATPDTNSTTAATTSSETPDPAALALQEKLHRLAHPEESAAPVTTETTAGNLGKTNSEPVQAAVPQAIETAVSKTTQPEASKSTTKHHNTRTATAPKTPATTNPPANESKKTEDTASSENKPTESPLRPKPKAISYAVPERSATQAIASASSTTDALPEKSPTVDHSSVAGRSGSGSKTRPVTRRAASAKAEYASNNDGLSVAQVLLQLTPHHLRIIKLISQRGYVARHEFAEQLEDLDADSVDALLNDLWKKKLVRIIGAEPDEAYIFTEWASESLDSPKAGR